MGLVVKKSQFLINYLFIHFELHKYKKNLRRSYIFILYIKRKSQRANKLKSNIEV